VYAPFTDDLYAHPPLIVICLPKAPSPSQAAASAAEQRLQRESIANSAAHSVSLRAKDLFVASFISRGMLGLR